MICFRHDCRKIKDAVQGRKQKNPQEPKKIELILRAFARNPPSESGAGGVMAPQQRIRT
jgi:hypothetical protein